MRVKVITTFLILNMIIIICTGCIDDNKESEEDKDKKYSDRIINLNGSFIEIPDINDSLPIEYTFSISEMNVSNQYERPLLYPLKNDQIVLLIPTDEVNIDDGLTIKRGDGEPDHLFFIKLDSDGKYLVHPKVIINTTKCDMFYLFEDSRSNLHLFWLDQRGIDFKPGHYPMYGKLYYKQLSNDGDIIIDDKILLDKMIETSRMRFQGIIEITPKVYQFSLWEENLTSSIYNMSEKGDIITCRTFAPQTFGSLYKFRYDNSGNIDINWKDENNTIFHEQYNSSILKLIKRDIYSYIAIDPSSSFPMIYQIGGIKYLGIRDNESNSVIFNLNDTSRAGLIINFNFSNGYSIIPSLQEDFFYSTSIEGIHYRDNFSSIHITKLNINGIVETFNAPLVTILGEKSIMKYGPSIWMSGVVTTPDNGLNILLWGNDGTNNYFIIILNLDNNLKINFIEHIAIY